MSHEFERIINPWKVVIEAGVGNDEETEADQSLHQNIESNGTLVIAKTPVDLDV